MLASQSRTPAYSTGVRTVRTTLTPTPGFVCKTLTLTKAKYSPGVGKPVIDVPAERKVFINICYDDHIPPPADVPESVKKRAMQGEENAWGVPHVVSEGRTDVDRAGKPALVFDVIFHPSISSRVEEDYAFKEFIKLIALESVEDKSGLSLSRETSVPKLPSKGKLLPRPAIVPVPVQKPAIEVLSDTPSTPSLTADLSSPTSSAPAAAASDAKQVPRWSWEPLDNGEGVRIVVTLPGMTRAHHSKTTLDLEPRRLILSSPAFATLDTPLNALPRDLDIDHAQAEFHVAQQRLILNAGWA